MTKIWRQNLPCAYCGNAATEPDHIIARQFFPAKQIYRGGLPQVPVCRSCNGAKQKVEDGPGVIFQFGHFSEASRQLLLTRVRRTLRKNRRLHRSLQRSLHRVLVKRPSGVLVPSFTFTLSPRELSDIWAWFRYVAKGLYYFELCSVLPAGHTIHLVKPATFEQFVILRDLIVRDSKREAREYASGELRYVYARNEAEQLTMWLLAFKSIDMFWLTVGPASAAVVPAVLADIEWKAPTHRAGVTTRPSKSDEGVIGRDRVRLEYVNLNFFCGLIKRPSGRTGSDMDMLTFSRHLSQSVVANQLFATIV